jgi:reactive intermediate/imine deaminase
MSQAGPVKAFFVPGIPHPLLCPEKNEGWQRLRDAFDAARKDIEQTDADIMLIYSTMWPSVIGHQIQADPKPEWVHVDELFHDLGSIEYSFKMDSDFAHELQRSATNRGLQSRTVAYHGFPIDTGSVVALKLLNPDNALPACIVSSNVYADRAETIVFAKAARDALAAQGKKAVVVVVGTLSNRLFTDFIDPADDHIHSAKDDEWNNKLLEFMAEGRLEDVAQLSREIQEQIRVKKVVNFKPMWWLSGIMGQHNNLEGKVYDYAPLYGTGSAVIGLTPSMKGYGDKEFDEDDVETFSGDRNVISKGAIASEPHPVQENIPTAQPARSAPLTSTAVIAKGAPSPVGSYPHARKVGDMLYLSGVGPRDPNDNSVPGGPVRDEHGPLDYDIRAQTRATLDNIKIILEGAGSSFDRIIDVTGFLIDMDRDFKGYNEVYAEYFNDVQAARTTLEITALPTPIAVEFKVIALAGKS